MVSKKIKITHLLATAGLIVILELAGRKVGGVVCWSEYVLLGVIRLLEATAVLLYIWSAGPGLEEIGLERSLAISGLWTGIRWSLCFAVIASAGLGILYFSGVNVPILFRMFLPSGKTELVLFLFVACLPAPVTEEIVFRGVLFGFIRPWGLLPAVLLSACIFTVPHFFFGWFPALQAFVGGIVFALAYERSKSLLAPMVIHSTGNAAIFSLGMAANHFQL